MDKVEEVRWKYRQHRNYNTLYTMPGVQRKDIVVGYNSFENDKEAMEFISMLKGEDERQHDENDEDVPKTSHGRVLKRTGTSQRDDLKRKRKRDEAEESTRGPGKRVPKPRSHKFSSEQYEESIKKSKKIKKHNNTTTTTRKVKVEKGKVAAKSRGPAEATEKKKKQRNAH